MSRPRANAAIILSAVGVLLMIGLGAGCSTNSADWFNPDWNRVTLEKGGRDAIQEVDLPAPSVTKTPAEIPDQGPIDLSIEQAVMLALQRNRGLDVQRLTPVVTGAFEQIERGQFDPELFANAQFGREESVETARSTGGQFNVKGDESTLEGGVRQTLPTGTDVEVGITQDRTISNRAPEQQQARLGLTVTQSLLRGFGPAVNLVSIRQAQLDTAASLYELRGFVEELVAQTETAYWRYLLALRRIEIVERSLEVARQQGAQVDERINVGVLPRTEAAATRSEIALREQALIDARSELRAARLQLAQLMNIDFVGDDADRPITATSKATTGNEDVHNASDAISLAERMRPDLNEARLRLDQNRLETIRTRNGLLPRLDVFFALGKSGFANTYPNSFHNLDERTYDVTVGMNFSQFIGNTTAKGEHRAAVATRQQASAAVQNLSQLVELDVRLALNEAERARQQIAATATTRALQAETVDAEKQRFDAGASTTLQVAQAQRDLLEAQINEVEAIVNYRIALVGLYLAEGSLLERRGVDIPTAE